MTWWLLYNHNEIEPNKRYIQFYFEACKKRNIELQLLDRDLLGIVSEEQTSFLYNGKRTDLPEVVINRTRDHILAKIFEMAGCRLYNSSEVTLLGNNKLLAIQHVARLGIRTMKTCYGNCEGLNYPYVAKSLDGHGGTEVFLVKNDKDRSKLSEEFDSGRYIFQKFCSQPGRDLRVYLVGKDIVAGMLRVSDDDFRSNYCLGGKAFRYELNEQEISIVDTIAQSLDIGHCGIDFIFDEGELVFNEIEDVVGSRMLYSCTDIDVVDMYVDHIYSEKNNL